MYNFWSYKSSADTAATSTYKTLEINVNHPIRCTQLAVDHFRRQKLDQGLVLLVSSIAAQRPAISVPIYAASKAAVSHFVRSMEPLEQIANIRVNAVAPALVRTTLWNDSGRDGWVDEQKGDFWITPDRIGEVMLEMVRKPEYAGGSVWEVGAERVRKVEAFNDPGPGTTEPGFTAANVGLAQVEFKDLFEANFGT